MVIETVFDGKQGTSSSDCRKISEADYRLRHEIIRRQATTGLPGASSIASRFCLVYPLSLSSAHCIVHLTTKVRVPGLLQFLERARKIAITTIFLVQIAINVFNRKVGRLRRRLSRTSLNCKRELPRQVEYQSFRRVPPRAVRGLFRIKNLSLIKFDERICVFLI